MNDTDKDIMILTVMAEANNVLTARQISLRTVQYQAPVSERDVNIRLQHLRTRSCVFQGPGSVQEWIITPAGIKWLAQNRRK